MPEQRQLPEPMPFGRGHLMAGGIELQRGVEAADHLGRPAFDDIGGLRQQGVIPAAGARHLAAGDGHRQRRVARPHGVAAEADRLGEAFLHEGLEIDPGGEAAFGRGDGLGGRQRCHRVPVREGAAPGGVERGERGIGAAQPLAEGGQAQRAAVEIPFGGEIGDAGFIAQIEEERPAGRGEFAVHPGIAGQPRRDAGAPGGIQQARFALEYRGVGGVFPVAPLGFLKEPVLRQVRPPAVIGAVEIGRDVLDIPAKAIGAERGDALPGAFGVERPLALADDHAAGEAKPMEAGIGGLRLALIENHLVIRPILGAGGTWQEQQQAGEQHAQRRKHAAECPVPIGQRKSWYG